MTVESVRNLFAIGDPLNDSRGFTLAEIMVILAILAILVVIAVPNFINASNRAKEASLKANMHAFQFVAEDYLVKHGTNMYAPNAADLAPALLKGFDNPYDQSTGAGHAWEDRASLSAGPSAVRGITSYADSAGVAYNIMGHGSKAPLSLVLSSGNSSIRSTMTKKKSGGGDEGPIKRSDPTEGDS